MLAMKYFTPQELQNLKLVGIIDYARIFWCTYYFYEGGIMPRKAAAKLAAEAAPQSPQEAAEWVRRIGKRERELSLIEDELNAAIAEVQERAVAKAQPVAAERDKLVRGVAAYGEANRALLTQNGKTKTVKLPGGGEFGWRFTPPKASVRNAKQAIAWMKSHRLKRFIRLKEEVSKEKLLAEPAVARTIPGISIARTEEFFIQPHELEVEISGGSKKVAV